MRDPFALLPVAPELHKKEESRVSPKKLYWTVGVLAGVILILGFAYYLKSRTVSADVNSSALLAGIEVTGLPTQVKSSDEISATITVTNKTTQNIPTGYILVSGQGVDLAATVKLAQNLAESDPGYLRVFKPEEQALFSKDGVSGIYWNIGPLGSKQVKSQQIKGIVSGTIQGDFKIEAKYFLPKYQNISCGTLGLSSCRQSVGQTQIGYESLQTKLTDQAKIKLRSGYNFIALPYVFTPDSIKTFLSSLKDKWAYYFKADTAEYIDLNKDDNAKYVVPGAGLWIFDSSGGEYTLPDSKVQTNINEMSSINLNIGWNQIGNPYPARMILSGSKILVREIADDGSASGNVYSLKSAIDNQVLSVPYIVTYKSFTDSNANTNNLADLLEYKVMPLESTLNPFSGLTIKSNKKVTLIFPGREIIAPGDLLSAAEKAKIEVWISSHGLNQFGDNQDTVYTGGTPLTDSTTGASVDRFDYIVLKHPERPWNS